MPPRIPTPFRQDEVPLVEPIAQLLYDFGFIPATAQSEVRFFSVPRSQNIALGTGTLVKSTLFTNIDSASMLPSPKIALIYGWHVILSPLNYDGNAVPADGFPEVFAANDFALANTAQIIATDFQRILRRTWTELHIGSKQYGQDPTFAVPALYGHTGVVAIDSSATTPPGTIDTFARVAIHQSGMARWIEEIPILLPPLQSFYARLVFPFPQTLGRRTGVWFAMSSSYGREVQ